jgi:YggT family protein
MQNLISFLQMVVDLYIWVVIFNVIFSWLLAFGVMNAHSPFVRSFWQAIQAVTEPLLAPIRSLLPSLGGLDISPIILWLACIFVRDVVLGNLKMAIA